MRQNFPAGSEYTRFWVYDLLSLMIV